MRWVRGWLVCTAELWVGPPPKIEMERLWSNRQVRRLKLHEAGRQASKWTWGIALLSIAFGQYPLFLPHTSTLMIL